MVSPKAKPDEVLDALQPLLATLYAGFEEAIQQALKYFSVNSLPADGAILSWLVRYGVRVALEHKGVAVREEEEAAQDSTRESAGLDVRSLSNNGLLVFYRGCQIRLRKGRGLKLPPPTSESQADFYEQRLEDDDFLQLRLFEDEEFAATNGARRCISMNLLVLWDVDSNLHLRGLRLIKPVGEASIEWSVKVPHPAESIQGGDSLCLMYDPDLPIEAEPVLIASGK